jgi:hypothetical protein
MKMVRICRRPDLPTSPGAIGEPAASASETGSANNEMESIMVEIASPSLSFLVQLRCDGEPSDAANERRMAQLHALHSTVDVFGGRIEHHWASSREYDLILVIRMPAHRVSFTALEMALRATQFVRAAHSTPLYSLDPPSAEPLVGWSVDIGDDAILTWDSNGVASSNDTPRPAPDPLEPVHWDEF